MAGWHYCGLHDVRFEAECFMCARRIPEPAQPDPKRPCDTHGISDCERCSGWCDHGAPDPKDALTPNGAEFVVPPPSFVRNLQDRFAALTSERDQLRARVQELDAERARLLNLCGYERADLAAARAEITRLKSVCDERQASREKAWKDRDAARAECQRLKADIVDVYERCERLEAQAARMREALECIETGHDPSTGEPNASAAIAKQALAETDAGALVRGLVEALQFYGREEQVLGGSDYQEHGTSSYRQSTDDGGKRAREALDAWDAGGRGRDGDAK